MKTKFDNLHPIKQLHLIYPDIQGQLCSRHSTLFGKLRITFNKLYDNMQPENYVIVKGNCQIVQEALTQLKLSLALENGFIILTSKTYKNAQIYVNSNHFNEEIIFKPSGKVEQGLNCYSQQMELIIKDATANLSKQQLFGGIMYAHATIPQNSFKYKQVFLMTFYISILTINNNLNGFKIDELIQKMANLKFLGTKESIERQFLMYKNRKFNLSIPKQLNSKNKSLETDQFEEIETDLQTQMQQENSNHLNLQKKQILLKMDKNYKFLFCKLDLSKQDVKFEFRRRKQIQNRKKQLINQLKEKKITNGLLELSYRLNQINLKDISFTSQYNQIFQPRSLTQFDFQKVQEEQILQNPQKFLSVLLKQIQLLSEFSHEKIGLEELIDQIWEINSKKLRLHSRQVVQLVDSMKQRLYIKSCMVINQNFLMIVVQKNKYTELICDVKHKMNQGQFKSKSLFKIMEEQQLRLQRWSSDKQIGQKMFTSAPSQGLSIFDPTDSIWFD